MRPRETVLDIDQVFGFALIGRVKIMRNIACFVLDQIISRVEAARSHDASRPRKEIGSSFFRHIQVKGCEKVAFQKAARKVREYFVAGMLPAFNMKQNVCVIERKMFGKRKRYAAKNAF